AVPWSTGYDTSQEFFVGEHYSLPITLTIGRLAASAFVGGRAVGPTARSWTVGRPANPRRASDPAGFRAPRGCRALRGSGQRPLRLRPSRSQARAAGRADVSRTKSMNLSTTPSKKDSVASST